MKPRLYRALLDVSAAERMLPPPPRGQSVDTWELLRTHLHAARMALEAEWTAGQGIDSEAEILRERVKELGLEVTCLRSDLERRFRLRQELEQLLGCEGMGGDDGLRHAVAEVKRLKEAAGEQ